MKTVCKAVLFILTLSSTHVFAQHRIKMKNNSSLFVSIDSLTENKVYFHFTRQDRVYSVSRAEITQLQNLVADPMLLQHNFELNSPYSFVNFTLDDKISFNKYLKFNGLNYRQLDAKILAIGEDSIRFLTFLDTRYSIETIEMENIEIVNYSRESSAYIRSSKIEASFMDMIVRKEGKNEMVYVYELGYQGIKYSKEALPAYTTTYENGQAKVKGLKGMLFMPYNEIESVFTYDGYRFLIDQYAPVQARKEAKLKAFVKLELIVGSGIKFRQNNTAYISSLEYQDGRVRSESKAKELATLYSPINFDLRVLFPNNISIYTGYDYAFSQMVSFDYDQYLTTGEAYLGKATYRTRLHTFRLGGIYMLGKFRLGLNANTVLTRSPFTWQQVGYFDNVPQTGAIYEGFIKSTQYIRWGASVGYTLSAGKISVVPSLGYERFEIDFANTSKNKASREVYAEQPKAYASSVNGLRHFRNTFASSMTKWEVLKMSVALSYKF